MANVDDENQHFGSVVLHLLAKNRIQQHGRRDSPKPRPPSLPEQWVLHGLESPAPGLLSRGCNCPPTMQDRERIREVLSKVEERVGILDQTQQRVFNQFIECHKALMAPVRRLPPELLMEIFRLVIPPRSLHTKFTRMVPDDPPYKLSHALSQTCSYWRNLALSMPELWTSIPAITDLCMDSTKGFHIHVALFLERSQSLPLDIIISIPHCVHPKHGDHDPRDRTFFPLILYLLITQCYRWQSAVMHIHYHIFERLPSLRLPILEQLNVRCCNGHFMPANMLRFPRHIFAQTPSLKHLIMDGQHSNSQMPSLLQTVESFVGLPGKLDDIRGASGTLRECTLRGPMSSMRHPQSVIRFEVLQSLSISNTNYTYPELEFGRNGQTAFKWIEAPFLEHLSVEGHPTIDNSTQIINDILSTTIASSGSRLRSLTLHIVISTEAEFHKLLRATTHLTSLDVWDLPEHYFDALVFKAEQDVDVASPLVPCLKMLTVRSYTGDGSILKSVQRSRQALHFRGEAVESDLAIRLVYPSAKGCNSAYRRVEDSLDLAKRSEYWRLVGWSMHLTKQFLTGLSDDHNRFEATGKRRPQMRSTEELVKLSRFVSVLEAYQVKSPRLLESTRILQVLTTIRDLPNELVVENRRYNFTDRADSILKSWSQPSNLGGTRWRLSACGRVIELGL